MRAFCPTDLEDGLEQALVVGIVFVLNGGLPEFVVAGHEQPAQQRAHLPDHRDHPPCPRLVRIIVDFVHVLAHREGALQQVQLLALSETEAERHVSGHGLDPRTGMALIRPVLGL